MKDAARFCAERLIQYFPGKCVEELAIDLEVGELARFVDRPRQTEASFQAQVIQLAQLKGWLVHAERPARTADGWRTAIIGDPGWPDLVLVKANGDDKRIIFAELKAQNGKPPTHEQLDWLMLLGQEPGTSVRSFVWRPRDWDRIVAELSWPEES